MEYAICQEEGKMGKNNFWVVRLEGKAPELIKRWSECEEKVNGASRAIYHGFRTEDEAVKFMHGMWREKPISEEARIWLEEYKAKAGQLKQDTDLDMSKLSPEEYPKYCAYVDGSFNPKNKSYGFGVVFMCDGNIEKIYGGGEEKDLVPMGCAAGELLACMEAIKHAADLNLPEITIIFDSQIIPWAYHGCGTEMLTQAAGQYMYDIRDKMKIDVVSIEGLSHEGAGNSPKAIADKLANTLADKLAKKGAGIVRPFR